MERDDALGTVNMPTGEVGFEFTQGHNGEPVRLKNATMPFLSNVKAAHAPYWRWGDYGRHYRYKDRCGTWADFRMASQESPPR